MIKRSIILAILLSALIICIMAAWPPRMRSSEVFFYFEHPSKKDELIELTIVSRVPPELVESRMKVNREKLRHLVLKAVLPAPPDSEVVREVRREILEILDLEGKARSVEFNVVPDFSARPRDEGIRKTLEGSHG